ncbi:MAG: GGDEF domain-containing protein [Lachnospiraceae bacterium]|nr:GGDEF domain-containing protein [Lachnospiraceae bacterium]
MKKRYTIGILQSGITDTFTKGFCKGVKIAEKELDVNYVVLPCKYLDRDLSGMVDIQYEYQYNTLFSSVSKANIDAVIVSAGSIGCHTTPDRVKELLAQYEGMPIVLVAGRIDDYVCLNYDNRKGVREGLEYLIRQMKVKNICMVGGPDGNADARERKQEFFETLGAYGLLKSPLSYVEGDMTPSSRYACEMLLATNPDVEAVFCVNDDTALAMYEVARRRGREPGRDLKIFGYDNTIAGSKEIPSLSTVDADPALLGYRSMQMITDMLDGKPVSSEVVPANFILRNSFGEVSGPGEQIDPGFLDETRVDRYFDEAFSGYKEIEAWDERGLRNVFRNLVEEIIRETKADVLGKEHERIEILVDDLFDSDIMKYADTNDLVNYMIHLYTTLLSMVSDGDRRERIYRTLLDMYHRIILVNDKNTTAGQRKTEADLNGLKLFVRESQRFKRGSDQCFAELLSGMRWVGVRDAFLYILETPIRNYGGDFSWPKSVLLKAVMINGDARVVPESQQYKLMRNIFSNEYVSGSNQQQILIPVFCDMVVYGLLLCDLSDVFFDSGEFFVNQVGSAVRMISLLKENETIQSKLEDSLYALREHNVELKNISKKDAMTNVFNRRGFMEEAEKLLAYNREERKRTMVAYADMNNLKIVNDRFGHEAGDYAIKTIARMLSDSLDPTAVVGRMGGDEFSFVTATDGRSADEIAQDLKNRFYVFNLSSDKPYNVDISIGCIELSPDDGLHLEEAIGQADARLYAAKKTKGNVLKEEVGTS